MDEHWMVIPGYECDYMVSSIGRVKSIKYKRSKIIKSRLDIDGYYVSTLYLNGKPKTIKNHQLVAMAFLGHSRCGMKMVVDHINNNKEDNRISNLQIITLRENCSKDKVGKSKYTGVSIHKGTGKWKASVRDGGRNYHLGLFDDEYDAYLAYINKLNIITNKINN